MRLAFFNSSKGWGGVKTWTVEFAAALQQRGHEVHIFGRPGPFVERATAMGLPAHAVSFGPDFNPVAISRFISFFKKNRTDAVLVNVGRDVRTAGIAAAIYGIPVAHRIGLPRDMRNHWKVRTVHKLIKPHYLCPCEYIRSGMLQMLPFIDKKDSTVILSAKKPAQNAPVLKHHDEKHPLTFVTTSQLNADKGHIDVLQILARLKAKGHNFHWHVAGKGTQQEDLKAQCAALGLQDNITWHGFTQNVTAVLALGDVFILPSLSEGLPNTLLEAMAQGLIPVARDIGGINEVWPQEAAGMLLPHANFQTRLEQTLEMLLQTDPTQLHVLSKAAWEKCRTSFSMQTQAPKLEAFFNNLISGTSA
ncbi:glycosyltransferase [Oleidesulfovibrio sp.]|uniref:glycosyltransferase n=1 Tax=Oleidesulfovibrio sp. TaxID=2909707 RepID=UPI003A840A0C